MTREPRTDPPEQPEPESKDWTWVLDRPCPDCGLDVRSVSGAHVPGRLRAMVGPWTAVLGRGDVRERPAPVVWSPLEYACHVRDVCAVMDRRRVQMIAEDDPEFADWDQDAAAVQDRYWTADPDLVAHDLAGALESAAAGFETVRAGQWQRRGRRGDGAPFTVETLARYLLHDVVHHAWDVRA